MKQKEVLRILQINRITLSRYVKQGKIRVITKHNGLYDYNEEDVWKLQSKRQKERKNVIYQRVSTRNQKNDLENQINYLKEFQRKQGLEIHEVYKDIGSGIELSKRKNFMRMFQDIKEYKVQNVFITYKDRLSRIGFDFLEEVFKSYGTKIIIMDSSIYDDEKMQEKELFKELITIIHSYIMRLYSNRRKKKKLEYIEEELKHGDKNI